MDSRQIRALSLAALTASTVVACAGLAGAVERADGVAGDLMLVSDNAGWSWFQDERAVVDPTTANVLIGTIGSGSGSGGASRAGVVDVNSFNLATRRVVRTPIGVIAGDDHNTPALLVRPDGRYLAVFNDHNADKLTRYSISTAPGDPTSWQEQPSFANPATVTYANTFFLAAEGKIYDFNRSVGYDPNYLVSSDLGASWAHGGQLLRDPADSATGRPYVKYVANGTDRVDFITTETHPRDHDTGVYHGYMRAGALFKSDGSFVAALGRAPPADAFTPLLLPGQVVNGRPRNRAWTTDLALDSDGNPVALFTSRVEDSITDHRLYYGRSFAGAWSVHEMAVAGAGLYWPETDYTGLGAIDPRDPNTVYIASDIDPRSAAALPFHEVFQGVTINSGRSWTWTPITERSTVDNLRPIALAWPGGRAVLWMRGAYSSYTDYDTAIVGVVLQDGETTGKIQYTDATPSNTTLADGDPLTTTGPAPGGGPTDDAWHRRSGAGNGDGVFTAGETGDEDAPAVKTTLAAAAGEYDVFAFFWADPDEDWQVSLGLAAGEMRTFRRAFTEQASAEDFASSMIVTGTTVHLYKAYLGRVRLHSPTMAVFVDDSSRGAGSTTRTWYDGVGVAAVARGDRGTRRALARVHRMLTKSTTPSATRPISRVIHTIVAGRPKSRGRPSERR